MDLRVLAELIADAESVKQRAQRIADRFVVAGRTVAQHHEIEAQTSSSPEGMCAGKIAQQGAPTGMEEKFPLRISS